MFALLTLFLWSLSTSFSRTKYNSLEFAAATLGCGDILYGAAATLECNSPAIFAGGFLQQMPAGAKDIFVQLEIKIENYCSLSAPYHFYTLTIEPTTGTTVKLMDVQWNGDKDFTHFSQDGSSIKTAHKAVAEQIQPPNQWFSATSWVLLGSNKASGAFNYYGKATTTSGGAVSYPTTWTVDMNTKIYACSDVNAATSIKCQVANFKIWYHLPITPIYAPIFKDGTTPKLIARYQLNQYTGYEVINSVSGTIGSGYFGSSTALGEDPVSANKPSWVPEEDPGNSKLMTDSGIEFTDTTQYVTLPVFPMMPSLFTPAYSLTVKLWFKPSATPSTISYIFRFARATSAGEIFSLQLNTNMKCMMKIYNLGISSDAYLSASSWNSIAMSLTSQDNINIGTSSGYPYSYSLVINNVLDVKNQITLTTRYFHQTNNIVRLGGPPTAKGIISGVEIYSPGSNFITADTTCQPSTCLRDIGITSPSTCILAKCATNCAACFNSQENGCITCNPGYRLYQSKCIALTCKPGKFLSPVDTCQGCIAHCESCSDAVSCDVCETGFVKQGSICVCPPGSVLDSTTNACSPLPGQNNNNPAVTCKYPFKIVASGTPEEQCVLDINEEDAEQAEQVAKISTVASYATNFGGALIALLSYNNVGLLLIGSLTEMLSYIQYLKIDYPPKVYQMLQEQDINAGGINIITEIPEEVAEAIPNRPLPEEFAKNDTHSSFVANCWELLVSLVSILVSIGLISFIVSCLNGSRNSRLYSFLSKLLLSLRWNLFLGIFCSSYGFTGIFTALEFRTVNMDSLLSILSFIVSLAINTLGFCLFFFIFHLSMIFCTIKTSVRDPLEQTKQIKETEQKWKSYGVLIEDYKNDFLSQKIFLFIFMFRTYIHYSILGYLNEYPLIQTCSFTIISICMITYLIRRRPMKGKMIYIQQMVCEMAILVVNITVVILASMDKWEIHDHDTRVKVGDVIIATNFGLSIAGSTFLVIETFSQIKEAYMFLKSWFRSQKAANIKIIKRNLDKDYPFSPPQSLETESKLKDLEISDLERSNNDISVDQLRGPRNLIKSF